MSHCSVLIQFFGDLLGGLPASAPQSAQAVTGPSLLTNRTCYIGLKSRHGVAQFLAHSLRKLLLTIAVVCCFGDVQAQFGNEWINYSQQYYKIPVTQTGMYRLTRDELVSAGLPVSIIDPRRIQIFRRGIEQSIYFNNNQQPANGVFETGEYLEFYGEKNDGATDVDMYKNPLHHPHAYMNLYSDTAWYFLTWNLLPVQGKRMTVLNPEFNVGGLPTEIGFNNTALTVLYNQYSAGNTFGGRAQSSFFDEGEGWTGPVLCNTGCSDFQDLTLSIPSGVTSQSPPQLEVLLAGRFDGNHLVEIYAGASVASLRLVGTSSFLNYKNAKVNAALQWTDVAANGNVVIRVKAVGVSSATERVSVSYAKLNYVRDFNWSGLSNQVIQTIPNTGGKSYFEIQNPPANLRLIDVTDISNASIIGTYGASSNLAAIVNGTASSRKIFATSSFITPTLKRVSFRSITPTSHDYLIISNSLLRKPGAGFSDPVKAYAAYRASVEGGGYDTLVVNIDLLYNQFNYGETSPRAVYQFLKYMASGNPKYLFIIGKGLDVPFAYDRYRVVQPTDYKDLVPTAGWPGSDLAFSAGIMGTTYQPAIATGRIPAATPNEVNAYLNKIIETENQPFNSLWKKRVLHLSGGINSGEPQTFRYYVDGFKEKATPVYYGAQVTTQSKQTLEPDEQVNIAPTLNAGVSLVTFFGHASTTALDLDLGSINNPDFGYNNVGKYPAFLINGCNIGRMYSNGRVFPEEWILAAQRGAKSFISHSSFGYENLLRFYSDLFYHFSFSDSSALTLGIGDVQLLVADSIIKFGGIAIYNLSITQQMVLMGDPAVKVFGATKPDYAIENDFLSKYSLDGKPVTAATPSFGIRYKIRNYGQARNDSLRVALTRTFPNNMVVAYDTLIAPVLFESEFIFVLDNPANSGGSNIFQIKIDDPNVRAELDENNNTALFNLFIPSSATYNLFPYPYGIANSTSVELVFQNTNQAPAYRQFLLELDTVPSFSSTYLKQFTIGADVLARQTITILNQDSVVYFWRSRLAEPTTEESADWFTSSFMYVNNGEDGWGQAGGSQLSENVFEGLKVNSKGELAFPEKVSTIFIRNFGGSNPTSHTSTSVRINTEEFNVSTLGKICRNNTINILPFDKVTGSPYVPIQFAILDQRMCGREPQVINSFTLAEAEASSNGLAQAIQNIAVNDSVVFFTIGNPSVPSWSSALYSAFNSVGLNASQLAGFQAGEPLIIFARKGASLGSARVIRSGLTPATEQELVVNETVTSRLAEGAVITASIGPAKQWLSLSLNVKTTDAADEYAITVMGVKIDGNEEVLYEGTDNDVDLSFIDAAVYPKLKLQLFTRDLINLSPVTWKNWLIKYTPVPEAILLARTPPGPVMIQEGATWPAKYSLVNVTPHSFMPNVTSLPFRFRVENNVSSQVYNKLENQLAPESKDSIVVNVPISTIGFGGINDVSASVENSPSFEQYMFNNTLSLDNYLDVAIDQQPPVLDVTVDGRYLANGDVVSPEPQVNIALIDENQSWFKTDTVGIIIYVKNLDTEDVKRINFSNPETTWSPTTMEENFRVSFVTHLEPGEYELSILATDASGNIAGGDPYSVSFSVSDISSLSIRNPFPNPTAGLISFPVRISGTELPTTFSLKVFTPTGRMIQHATLNDVSGFFIGTNFIKLNISELEDGSLSSGVYLYRMEISGASKSVAQSGRIIFIRR